MDDVRYIILPGDLRKDSRLTLAHIKVAFVLGAYSKRHGWTDLTQNDVGEMAGLSRQTVCTTVGELVEWGWVARRKKPGKNQYVYRFIMDREDCQLEATVPQNDCQPQPTTNVASDPTFNKEASSTISQSTLARASAHATQGAARSARREVPRLLLSTDREWRSWAIWLRDKGQYRALDQFEAEGAMVVFDLYPSDTASFPKLAPPPDSEKRLAMEASRNRVVRDPTGEASQAAE